MKSKNNTYYPSLFLLGFVFLFAGCNNAYYTFTGTNTDAQTVCVNNFYNVSSQGPSNMGQTFTEKLKEYYLQNSRLKLETVESDADLVLRGNIISYILTPIAATGDSRAAQTRLSISVEVDFTNSKDDTKSFRQTFSFYQDFEQSQTLAQVENTLIETIFTQISLDIFNKTVADW